ncbi:MAG: metallophosphoesterase, partial [Alistipes sp.]|nr:metallophosphoesterase [Alistipes sp.]
MVVVISHAPLSFAIALFSRRWIHVLGGGVMVVAISIFFYSMLKTRTDYEVRSVEIESSKLPAQFDGYRIVQISDLHIGTMLNAEHEISRIAEICNSLKPDMVAFTGDLVNIRYSEINEQIFKSLQKFQYKDGLYSVLGNHDIGTYIKDSISLTPEFNTERLIDLQERLGWKLLDNKTYYIKRGVDSIAITGISFPKTMYETQ